MGMILAPLSIFLSPKRATVLAAFFSLPGCRPYRKSDLIFLVHSLFIQISFEQYHQARRFLADSVLIRFEIRKDGCRPRFSFVSIESADTSTPVTVRYACMYFWILSRNASAQLAALAVPILESLQLPYLMDKRILSP